MSLSSPTGRKYLPVKPLSFTSPLFCLLTLIITLLIVSACSGDDATPIDGDSDSTDTLENEASVDGDADDDQETPPIDPTLFYFGYGESDITPGETGLLGGYGIPGVHRAIEGVHDPLMAQVALFVNDAGQAFMLIGVDAAGYFYEFGPDGGPGIREVRQRISAALEEIVPLSPFDILISSTHSHTSTDLLGFWQDLGEGVSVDLLEFVSDGIVEAAVTAADSLTEAKLLFGMTELVGFTGRDDGCCSGVVDNEMAVLQVQDLNGDILLTTANYAKHPTQLPWNDNLASADFVYGFRSEIKALTGGEGLFIQGFCAAVHGGPRSGEATGADDYEKAYNLGGIIAETALAIQEELVEADQFDIRHRHKVYPCKVEGGYILDALKYFDMPKRSFTREGDSVIADELEVSWHKLGPAEFASFPGEGSPTYSLKLRDRMVSPTSFIVGLGNDELGYLIDPDDIAADPTNRLIEYELLMGPGLPGGPAAWDAMESLGWFNGEYLED